jgi:uncharacterized protein (DUF885 family)
MENRYYRTTGTVALCGWMLAGVAGLMAGPAAASMEGHVTAYAEDRRAVDAAYAVPWAEAAMEREGALLQQWQARLEAMEYDQFNPSGRVDWHLLRYHLQGESDDLALKRARLAEMEPLLAFRHSLQDVMARQEKRQDIDPREVAGILSEALKTVKALRLRVEAGKTKEPPVTALQPGAVLASRVAGASDALRDRLTEWFRFYDGFQPDFGWWVRQPHAALSTGLTEWSDFLRKEIAGLKGEPDDPLVGDPIGETALAAQLAREMIPYTAEELIAIGGREFEWCRQEMQRVAVAMRCEDGKAALAKIKDQHAAPGGQAALAVAVAEQAIRFVEEKGLVTLPPLAVETWRLGMLGPAQQQSLPYAVYSSPRMLVAFAHESMAHGDKLMSMRGNNTAFLHIVTPHELIPGHHLQGFMARRYQPHRQLFRTPFLVEGWALHWEMLLWDLGYLGTPEQQAGALFWRMHRCARILVSLKFHLGQMSPAQMVDFLVDEVGHERIGATAEVRRYIGTAYGPLYQAAYMLGGLQLRALYQELTGLGKVEPRVFHDAVLRENMIPVELIRAALKQEVLPRDWKPSWRF